METVPSQTLHGWLAPRKQTTFVWYQGKQLVLLILILSCAEAVLLSVNVSLHLRPLPGGPVLPAAPGVPSGPWGTTTTHRCTRLQASDTHGHVHLTSMNGHDFAICKLILMLDSEEKHIKEVTVHIVHHENIL